MAVEPIDPTTSITKSNSKKKRAHSYALAVCDGEKARQAAGNACTPIVVCHSSSHQSVETVRTHFLNSAHVVDGTISWDDEDYHDGDGISRMYE